MKNNVFKYSIDYLFALARFADPFSTQYLILIIDFSLSEKIEVVGQYTLIACKIQVIDSL